jgi:hypothetical protein
MAHLSECTKSMFKVHSHPDTEYRTVKLNTEHVGRKEKEHILYREHVKFFCFPCVTGLLIYMLVLQFLGFDETDDTEACVTKAGAEAGSWGFPLKQPATFNLPHCLPPAQLIGCR